MARLDEPFSIKSLRLRNRLALPPITTCYGSPDGEVTENILGFYLQRARDVGLVVVEAATVRPDGRLFAKSLGLWNDGQVEGMARLVSGIKAEGAAAMVQINHGGARAEPVPEGLRGASPSGVQFRPDVEPTVLTRDQIAEITADFVAAAGRAVAAGFDGIEVHGAHMYLLAQFLSPLTNRRDDRYGGDAVARATFAVEVVRGIRERLGAAYPITLRLNAVESMEGGQTVQDAIAAALALKEAGVDAFHVSLAMLSAREVDGRTLLAGSSALPKDAPRGANAPRAAEIRRATGLPVISVGKLGDEAAAAGVVEEGLADVVAIGRQMIADPTSAGKILAGRGSDIVLCRECLTCFASLGKGFLRCATNLNVVGEPQYAAK